MTIEVLGSGCAKCKRLFEQAKDAVRELGLDTEVSYITDIQKIVELGVMSSPVLTIGGSPVIVGMVPDTPKLKEIIHEHLSASPSPAA